MKKKWLAAMLSAVLAVGAAGMHAAALAGDLNGDGTVNIADAVILHRLIAEDETLEIAPAAYENADCDQDGLLTVGDVCYMLDAAAAPAETTAATTTAVTTTTTVTTTTAAPATTAATTTAAPAVTEAPSLSYTQIGNLLVSPYPFNVTRNEEVTLHIVGAPNTEYAITVYYKSGSATADGLYNKVSDAYGNVSWTWKVGGRTSAGNFRIVITGNGETTEIPFSVV